MVSSYVKIINYQLRYLVESEKIIKSDASIIGEGRKGAGGQSSFFLLQSRLFITRAVKNQGDAKIICKELCTECIALRHSKGSYKSELSIQCSAEQDFPLCTAVSTVQCSSFSVPQVLLS